MSTEKSYPSKAYRIGRLILTTVLQGGGAAVIDGCSTAMDGRRGVGVAIRRQPTVGRAVVLAWIGDRPVPRPSRWRLVPKRLTRSRGHLA